MVCEQVFSISLVIPKKHSQDLDFDQVDSRLILGQNFSSATGFQTVHNYLASNGLLEQAPGSGNSCGV